MSEQFVSILGGRYITDGHIVKSASPTSTNPYPIAQCVVGGQVGYKLKYNKKWTFYSVALIRAMYEEAAGEVTKEYKFKFTIGWKTITAIVIVLLLACTNITCNINVADETQQTNEVKK